MRNWPTARVNQTFTGQLLAECLPRTGTWTRLQGYLFGLFLVGNAVYRCERLARRFGLQGNAGETKLVSHHDKELQQPFIIVAIDFDAENQQKNPLHVLAKQCNGFLLSK